MKTKSSFFRCLLTAVLVAICQFNEMSAMVFKPETALATHAWRYAAVVALNFAVTAAVAWACRRAGLPDAVGVYLPVLVTVVPSYLLMRIWVFSQPSR